MTQQQETGCVLRLFGAQSTAVDKTVENFPPQWRAAAQWKSRGAETLVALQAQSPSGLKKAAQAWERYAGSRLPAVSTAECMASWAIPMSTMGMLTAWLRRFPSVLPPGSSARLAKICTGTPARRQMERKSPQVRPVVVYF